MPLFTYRRKRILTKYFDAGRSSVHISKLFIFLIRGLQGTKALLHKILIQIKSRILAMVIVKLWVCNRTSVTNPVSPPFAYNVSRITVNDRLQSHFFELKDRSLHHTFKPKIVTDVDRLLFTKILASIYKAHPVAFCISSCTGVNLFLGKSV